MPWKFNPFTRKLDFVGTSGGGSGTLQDVKEDGSTVVANATSINIVEPDAVVVTDAGGGQANVTLTGHALLAGRPGGQELIGGTAVGETLAGGSGPGDALTLRPNPIVPPGAILDGPVTVEQTFLGQSRVLIGPPGSDPFAAFIPNGILQFLVAQEEGITGATFGAYNVNSDPLQAPVFFGIRGRGTLAAPTESLDGDVLFDLSVKGFDNTDTLTVFQNPAELQIMQSGPAGAGFVPAKFLFETTENGGAFDTRLEIDGNGEVRVGSPTFAGVLHVNDGTGFTTSFAAQVQASDVSMTLPVANAIGALTNNGSGALTWATYQPVDAGLTALASLGAGIAVSDGADGWFARTLVPPAAGLTISNSNGVTGDPTFALANDLAALEALTLTGFAARAGASIWVLRNIVGTAPVHVVDGSGGFGDPTISLDNSGVTATTYGSATQVGQFTVTAKGLITAASNVTITGFQPLDTGLTALASLGAGIAVSDGADGWTPRSLAVTDSSSVDFTLTNANGTGGNPTITAVVLPAGVDHNSLANLATGDVHTQYAKLLGRATGQTLIGGTASGDDLIFESTSDSAKGTIQFKDRIDLISTTTSIAGVTAQAISLGQTISFTDDAAAVVVLGVQGTWTTTSTGGTKDISTLFFSGMTVTNSGAGATTLMPIFTFAHTPTYLATLANSTISSTTLGGLGDIGYYLSPTFNNSGAGTYTLTQTTGMHAECVVNTGLTVGTRRGMRYRAHTGGGAITNDICIDIESITGGTLNISLRSTGTAQMRHAGSGAFGVNAAPATVMDVNGDLATRSANLALANGNNDDIAIGARSFIRITGPTLAFAVRGIASGVNGKHLTLYNTTASVLTINNQDAGSAAANRIITPTGAGVVTNIANLIYDATLSRWIMF